MIYLVLILIVASLAFWPGLDAPFVLDDIPRIVENLDLRSLSSLITNLVRPYSPNGITFGNDPSRPLVYLIYGVIYQVWGPDSSAFHSINLGVHLLNGALLWSWLTSMAKSGTEPLTASPKLFATAFFLLAPIHAHTVLYAYGLSDLLGTTWLLLFLRALPDQSAKRWVPARLALILILALATKQSAAILPVLYIAQLGFFPPDTPSHQRSQIKTTLILFTILAAYLGGRYLLFGAIGDLEGRSATKEPLRYFMFQPVAISTYLRLTLWPVGLSFDHAMEPSTLTTVHWVVSYLLVSSLAVIALISLRQSTRSMGSNVGRFVGWLIAVYGLMLAPTSSFLPTVDYFVERRAYSANVALMALLAVGLSKIFHKVSPRQKVAITVFLATLGCLMTWQTAQRVAIRRDERRLWLEVKSLYPESPRALIALGALSYREGDDQAALTLLDPMVQKGDYMALVTSGSVYAKEGSPLYDPDRALALYERAWVTHPHMALAPYAMGRLYQTLGRDTEAEASYKRTLRIDPRHGDALNNLGTIYFKRGQWDEAEKAYQTLFGIMPPVRQGNRQAMTSMDPDDPNTVFHTALLNLATVYAKTKRWEEAFRLCQKESLSAPFKGHVQSLLSYLHEQGDSPYFDPEKAEYYARAAVRDAPQSAAFRFNLARLVQKKGRLEEAREHYLAAASLDPKDPDIFQNWGLVARSLGREEEAIRALKEALTLDPRRTSLRAILEEIQKRSVPVP